MSETTLTILIAVFGVLLSIIGFCLVFILNRIIKKQDQHDQLLSAKAEIIVGLKSDQEAIKDRQDKFDELINQIAHDLRELLIKGAKTPRK